jgi:alpha-tubulin suppressor-like RCC1 family protein
MDSRMAEPPAECLLFGAFADDACAHGKRVTIPGGASLAPLLFGGVLPPSDAASPLRPPPPFRGPVAAASVGADGYALAAASTTEDGLWQCQYDRPDAAWSLVQVEGLPTGERFSGVAVGDARCLALAERDGSVFCWRRRGKKKQKDGDSEDDDEDQDDDAGGEEDGPFPGRARCVLGPRVERGEQQQQQQQQRRRRDDDADDASPNPLLLRLPIAAVAAGRRHFLAVARPPHAAAFAWGCSARGQCGVAPGSAGGGGGGGGKSGSWVARPRLVAALGGVPLALCAAGDAHSLVASADGASVFCFGDRGGGVFAPQPELVDLPLGEAPVAALAAGGGGAHGLGLDAEGRAYSWGDGSWGQQIDGLRGRRVVGVVAGWRHSVLVLKGEE